MVKSLNKGISSPVGILIILICAVLVGGILVRQLEQKEEKETKVPEEKEGIANWETYRNEEYGFEIKYPPEEEGWFLTDRMTGPSLSYPPATQAHLFHQRGFCEEKDPNSCLLDMWDTVIIWIEAYRKPSDASVKDWLTKGLTNYLQETCSGPFSEEKTNDLYFYKKEDCHIIYITGSDNEYVYGLGLQFRTEESYKTSYAEFKLTTSDERIIEIFDKILSTFRFLE